MRVWSLPPASTQSLPQSGPEPQGPSRNGRPSGSGLWVSLWAGVWAIGLAVSPAWADNQAAPLDLQQAMNKLDQAASRKDLNATLAVIAPGFRTNDGLSRETLATGLQRLWQRFDRLSYRTTIDRWENNRSGGWNLETTTIAQGSGPSDRGPLTLEATIRSRQTWQDGKIVSQDILSEKVRVSAGPQPPTVQLRLDEQVDRGQAYNVEAIVQEPLGKGILAGGLIDQPVGPDTQIQPPNIPLEALAGGGLFKTGLAPATAGPRWIAVMLVSDRGMTAIGQRIEVK